MAVVNVIGHGCTVAQARAAIKRARWAGRKPAEFYLRIVRESEERLAYAGGAQAQVDLAKRRATRGW